MKNGKVSNTIKNKPDSKTKNRDTRRKTQNMNKAAASANDFKVGAAMPNDPSWYASNPQLLKDVASLSFANVLGLDTGLTYATFSPDDPIEPAKTTVPGIMCFNFRPTLGCGEGPTSAPTVAARFLYTYVRHANSGSANYEAADLFMMVAAWASAYSCIMDAQRAYGAMMHYSSYNRYVPRQLVKAMGYDYDDLAANLPGFRAAINLAARRLNSIKVPADISLIKRWSQLCSDYYLDANSKKGQIYLAKPDAFLKFEGYATETGTSLAIEYNEDNKTVEGWTDIINTLLAPLTSEEDVGIMSGDIMKAFGESITTVPMISEDYVTAPILSDEMLSQFHNAVIVGAPGEHTIVQSPDEGGAIVETLYVPIDSVSYIARNPRLLDFYTDTVSPEDVMVATRFNCGKLAQTRADQARLADTGTEVVVSVHIFTDTEGDSINYRSQQKVSIDDRGLVGMTTFEFLALCALTQFDWAPLIYCTTYGADEAYNVYSFIGDVENYTTITPDMTTRMNQVAVLSELATMKHLSI